MTGAGSQSDPAEPEGLDGVSADTPAAVSAAPRPAEPASLSAGTVHEINNILGGMLANLYLALEDLDPGHPVRARLEAVNDAALAIRILVRPPASAVDRSG